MQWLTLHIKLTTSQALWISNKQWLKKWIDFLGYSDLTKSYELEFDSYLQNDLFLIVCNPKSKSSLFIYRRNIVSS